MVMVITPCIPHAGAIPYSGSHFGPGSGPVHLTGVSCLRTENFLTDCNIGFFGAVPSHCRAHLEDVGVSCPSSNLH